MNIELCRKKKFCGKAFGSKLIITRSVVEDGVVLYWNYSLLLKGRCLLSATCMDGCSEMFLKSVSDGKIIIVSAAKKMKPIGNSFEASRECPFYTEHLFYDMECKELEKANGR